MEKLFDALYAHCDGLIEFRALPDTKRDFFKIDDLAGRQAFCQANTEQNLYFGVATRDGKGGRKSNIINISAVWCDADFKTTPKETVTANYSKFPFKASATVRSGNGVHFYWSLKEPVGQDDIAKVEDVNKRITQALGGDQSATDAAHILRVPGSVNHKYNEKPIVKLTNLEAFHYELEDFRNILPEVQDDTTKVNERNPAGWQDSLVEGVQAGLRHDTALRLAGRWIEKGHSDTEIIHFLVAWNQKNTPPKPELSDPNSQEIQDIIEYVKKAQAQSAPLMSDLKAYLDLEVEGGQAFTSKDICQALGAYNKKEKDNIYQGLKRLVEKGVLKKDRYRHGGYKRTATIECYDFASEVEENKPLGVSYPLNLKNFLNITANQLLQVSGRYDSGKSTFLFDVMARNYEEYKIVHILSEEWSGPAIKERQEQLGIPIPHPNIKTYPMLPGWEDLISQGDIALIDYVRASQNPFEIDAQIHRILRELNGGIAIFATQKHPGLDKPTGGQFAVNAVHHVILLDKFKNNFLCKIFRTKHVKNLEGFFRTFEIDENKFIKPLMRDWKVSEITWEKEEN